MQVVSFLAVSPGNLYPPERHMVLVFLRGWVDRWANPNEPVVNRNSDNPCRSAMPRKLRHRDDSSTSEVETSFRRAGGFYKGLSLENRIFFFYRAFIANTEIIKLSLFNIVPC